MLRYQQQYFNWILDSETGVGHSHICKSGSTTIQHTVPHKAWEFNQDIRDIKVRVAWIRHPIRRLESGYRFFKMNANRGIRNHHYIPVNSWEDYVDFSLKETNRHWNPQYDTLLHEGEYLPTVTHRFEDINELWDQYCNHPIKHMNKSEASETSEYRLDELTEKYSHDQRLWDQSCS